MARGCCNSLELVAVKLGVLDASTVGSIPATVGPSAVGVTLAAAAVEAPEGEAANAPGVAGVVELTAAAGAWGAVVFVRLETGAVD